MLPWNKEINREIENRRKKNREIIMARFVIILVIIAIIAECSVIKKIKNTDNLQKNNHVLVEETVSKMESTKVQLELETLRDNFLELTKESMQHEAELKALREKINEFLKNQEDIRSSKKEEFHIVSYRQFLSAICIIGAKKINFLVKLIYF